MSATSNYVPEREVAEAIEPEQYHMLCGRLPGLNAIQMSLCQKVRYPLDIARFQDHISPCSHSKLPFSIR